MTDATEIARRAYQAYVDKDRAAIEAVISEDFRFTSPYDNGIDRKTYFERCWPGGLTITGFDFINLVQDGERILITYEASRENGASFRNTEIMTIRGGKIIEVEVYFGWSIPHEAPKGGFVER